MGGKVTPDFVGAADHRWLRLLIDEHQRYVGRRRRELDARLKQPLLQDGPRAKRRLATLVLAREWLSQAEAVVPPRQARSLLFTASALADDLDQARAEVAGELQITEAALCQALFADLPGERVIGPPRHPMDPVELALRCNLALTQGLIVRASSVTIALRGNARSVVRLAQLKGLICRTTAGPTAHDAVLELSGPLALFRRTLLYGRALGSLVAQLNWCDGFELVAVCLLRKRELELRLQTGDPIFPPSLPRWQPSKLEQRFAADFARLAPDWAVTREPAPVRVGNTLLFPDFVLSHADSGRTWLLEIAGFWTTDHVERRLALAAAAGLNLIICVDRERNCADGELPVGARVVGYRRAIDAATVLAIITGAS